AAAPVADRDGMVGVERHLDAVVEAGKGLVDGVVDDLVDEVVEAPEAGRADVHARPQTDGLEALENLDVFCCIGRFGHKKSLQIPHLRASNTVSEAPASRGRLEWPARRAPGGPDRRSRRRARRPSPSSPGYWEATPVGSPVGARLPARATGPGRTSRPASPVGAN